MRIETVEDAVAAFDLDDVLFYETTAIRGDDYEVPAAEDAGSPEIQLDSRYRTAPDRVEYRIKVTVVGEFGRLAVDASVRYRASEDFDATPEALSKFGTEHAAPTLFPYLREAVLTLGGRVGVEVKLSPIMPGDIPF